MCPEATIVNVRFPAAEITRVSSGNRQGRALAQRQFTLLQPPVHCSWGMARLKEGVPMKMYCPLLWTLLGASFASSTALAQDTADAALVAEISRIRVIANHCHDNPADPERGNAWSPES